MSILPVSGNGPTMRPQSISKTSGSGFSVSYGPAGAAEAQKLAPIGSVDAMAAMLGLQDVDAPQERDRRAKARGETLLIALQRLQISLLDGSNPAVISAEIEQLARDVPQAADPNLRWVIEAIRLRCAVELARRDVPASHGIV